MRKVMILLLPIFIAGIFVSATSSPSFGQAPKKILIKMVEVNDNNYRFDPAEVRLKLDQPVEIVFQNLGTKNHEVQSPLFALLGQLVVEVQDIQVNPSVVVKPGVLINALSIKEIEIDPGRAIAVRFTPDAEHFEPVERGETLSFFFGCMHAGHLEKGSKGIIVLEQ